MITVKELIEKLKEFDPNLPVIMAEDEEGNYFYPLDDCVELMRFYHEKGKYSVEVGLNELVDGYDEEDVMDGPQCVVIGPGYPDKRLRELQENYFNEKGDN